MRTRTQLDVDRLDDDDRGLVRIRDDRGPHQPHPGVEPLQGEQGEIVRHASDVRSLSLVRRQRLAALRASATRML